LETDVLVDVGSLRRVDFSLVVLIVVLILFGGGIQQLARSYSDAGKGLIIYAREQKDLFVDAGLIRDSYRIRSSFGLAQRLREQTVIVATRTSPHTAYMGAGVIVGARHGRVVILTARHIVAHAGRKIVVFPDHTERYAVRVVSARDRDLALVYVQQVALSDYPFARLARETFTTGQQFVVMGHPGAKSWTASTGLAERHIDYTLLFCPTCDRGDSGAGAFDRSGMLHGIVVTKAIMRAPSAKTGRFMKVTAFQIEQPEAIRAFLRTAPN
jgi:Trypsin-like peptidase domain